MMDWKEAGRQSRVALIAKLRQDYGEVFGSECPELLDYLAEVSIPQLKVA